jgi:hypothetical protein
LKWAAPQIDGLISPNFVFGLNWLSFIFPHFQVCHFLLPWANSLCAFIHSFIASADAPAVGTQAWAFSPAADHLSIAHSPPFLAFHWHLLWHSDWHKTPLLYDLHSGGKWYGGHIKKKTWEIWIKSQSPMLLYKKR